jgi:hypothetical protein
MRTLAKPFLESTGAFFSEPEPSEGRSISTHGAPGAVCGGAFEALTVPSLSRRSVVATMIAAFAPAAGTAVALPKVVETAVAVAAPAVYPVSPVPTGESPELLALGAEVDVKLDAYRAAAARLAEARAIAVALWPIPPESILVPHIEDRNRFEGCWERAEDFEGKMIYRDIVGTDGKLYRNAVPLFVLQAEDLEGLLELVREYPDDWSELGTAEEMVDRIEAAKLYEAACAHAIEASEIVEVKELARGCASDLHSLLFYIREHVPRSVAGVLIMARAVMAYEEAQKESHSPGERASGHILGRELADAVLRLAGAAA